MKALPDNLSISDRFFEIYQRDMALYPSVTKVIGSSDIL